MDEPIALEGLLDGAWSDYDFRPFRAGVEICDLRTGNPHVALLRYAAGASVPRHRHPGLETVLVLAGAQSDERGRYPVGTCVLNTPGSEHSVWSDEGCVVLIQWSAPVAFMEASGATA